MVSDKTIRPAVSFDKAPKVRLAKEKTKGPVASLAPFNSCTSQVPSQKFLFQKTVWYLNLYIACLLIDNLALSSNCTLTSRTAAVWKLRVLMTLKMELLGGWDL